MGRKDYEVLAVEDTPKVLVKERQDDFTIPLSQLLEPEGMDCSNDLIPAGTTNLDGEKTVTIPILTSMKKVLFDDYKNDLYTFLNSCRRTGTLEQLVGSRVLNRFISRFNCNFKDVSFWRIDRENFYADVEVELDLRTSEALLGY